MKTITTSISISTEPWETAKLRFIADLSPEDQALFASATVENLFYKASVAFKKHEQDRIRKAQQKLKPFLDSIEGYGKALDIFAQISPSILCPLWGSVRVVLQTAQRYGEYHDKLVDMFARIGDNLPRFRLYEHLFPNHEPLLAALANAYLDIIRFSTDVMKVFHEVNKSSVLHRVSLKKTWKPLENQFDSYLSNFRRHQDNISAEVKVAQMIEVRKAQELERRCKILTLLSPIDYQAKHERVQRLRHPGTGIWFTENPKFRTWLDEDKSDSFCCFGIPGSGKTVLASAVIDTITLSFSEGPSVVCHHYCDYADQETLDFQNLVGSLTRQLLDPIRIPNDIERLLQRNLEFGFPLSLEQSQGSLFNALSSFKRTFIVLDGIDELSEEGQRNLVSLVQRLVVTTSPIVKVLLLFRREEVRLRKVFSNYQSVEISSQDNGQDIALFVRATIESKMSSGDLVIRSSHLREEIIHRLVEGAHDMFLWARFQIDEICDTFTDEGIREKLRNLPKDLAETYRRIVKKIGGSSDGSAKLQLAKKMFQLIVCAKRPLTTDELKEAVSIRKGDKELNTERIPADDDSRILQCCANLILFDRTDHTIRLAHHTVRQFLLRLPLNSQMGVEAKGELPISVGFSFDGFDINHHDLRDFHFELEYAEQEIWELCSTYLFFSDFENQIIRAEDAVAEFALSNDQVNMWLLGPFARPATWLASLIWRGFRQEAARDRLVILRAPNPPPKDPTQTLKKRYMLLEYIITFWASHASDCLSRGIITSGVLNTRARLLHPLVHGTRAQLKDLTFPQQTLFNIRPWLVEPAQSKGTPKALPFLPLFRWAIDHDFVVFLDMLQTPPQGRPLKDYYTHECEDLPGQIHPIRRACQSDSLEAFRYFVYQDMPGLLPNHSLAAYAIAKAVSHDDPYFLSMLLEHVPSEIVDTFQYVLCEALCYHSKLGNSTAVDRLLNSGADPSLKGGMHPLDALPDTDAEPVAWPLSWAIAGRHEAVVRILCKRGPHTPYPGIYMSIQEPLSFALEMKDLETARNLWSPFSLFPDDHTKDLKLNRQVLVAACEHALDVGHNEIAGDLICMALDTLKKLDFGIIGPSLWHIAARGGCISALDVLAEKEIPGINSIDSAGLTPLLAALQSPLNRQILENVFCTFIKFPEVDLDFTSVCGLNARDFAICHGFGYLAHMYRR